MPKVPGIEALQLPDVSFDTETTGVDFHHASLPFLATWRFRGEVAGHVEWRVDPYTRRPIVPPDDLEDLKEILFAKRRWLVCQGPKFDSTAMEALDPSFGQLWPWDRTHCTLVAGHVLDSSQPLNLTDLVGNYLGKDISPLEEEVHKAVMEARQVVRQKFSAGKVTASIFDGVSTSSQGWRIASQDDPTTPTLFSQDKMIWKADMWLPKAVAEELGFDSDHPWHTVTAKYALGDSSETLDLFDSMWEVIVRLGRDKLYRARLKEPRIAKMMEGFGLTVSKASWDELMAEYGEEAKIAENRCVSIAAGFGHELELPKSGNNNSLKDFVFGARYAYCEACKKRSRSPLGDISRECPKCNSLELTVEEVHGIDLEPIARSKKTGEPTFDSDTIDEYLTILPEKGTAAAFLGNLRNKRQRDTACSYMKSYARFWLPMGVFNSKGEQLWFRLHPTLNPTGTGTLRWSSSNPNEQNISNKKGFSLKRLFGPAPGREQWSLDAKNIELRIPAYVSGQREFIDLFERPDDPPYFGSNHLLIAHLLHPKLFEKGVRPDGVLDGRLFKDNFADFYRSVKAGNFCVQYGGVNREDGQGTADKTYGIPGAQTLIEGRFTAQSELNQACISYAQEHGYVETLPDRTVDPERGYPLYCEFNWRGEVKPTVPLNYFTQGSAMWWTARAMVRVDAYLARLNVGLPSWDFRCIIQGHDELVFDFPKGSGPEPWKMNLPKILQIKKLMEVGGENFVTRVPTPVKVAYNPQSWAVDQVICP